ncbi:MAG: TolC family protein, partial [Polyangiales bacterium]
MSSISQRSFQPWVAGALLCGTLGASPASALQPLETFLVGAKRANFDNRQSLASSSQRVAEVDVAKGRLYPSFSASGSYTFNQYEVSLPLPSELGGSGEPVVILPKHQFDGNLAINLPLIDVAAWKRVSAADAAVDAARASQISTQQDVEVTVFRTYYQLIGQEALLESAKRTLELLRQNLSVVESRLASGTASDLDVQRARAEIARAEGDIATADAAVVTARRQLATSTAVEPEPSTTFIEDDLHDEQTLNTWLGYS